MLALLAGCPAKPAPKQAAPPDTSRVDTVPVVQPADTPVVAETAAKAPPDTHTKPKPRTVPKTAVPDAVKRAFPAAYGQRRATEPFPHLVVYGEDGRTLGYEVFSDSAGTTVQGYLGLVPVLIYTDAACRPVRIFVLDCSETPGYLELAYRGGLLDKLLKYDPAKPVEVDAVSFATKSSDAIIKAVTGICGLLVKSVVSK
jgi:hypothetical protein